MLNLSIPSTVKTLHLSLDRAGHWIAPLSLRLFLAWEFFESGLEKFNGQNWFADIQERFPFPFNHIPANLNWELSMWAELICALAILLGLGTRISAFILIVVTVVATAAVHWPADWSTLSELAQGYAISNKGFGNYKLPLIYLMAFMPLLLSGPGKFSLDALLARCFWRQNRDHRAPDGVIAPTRSPL
jgi:putative oxidoreductase